MSSKWRGKASSLSLLRTRYCRDILSARSCAQTEVVFTVIRQKHFNSCSKVKASIKERPSYRRSLQLSKENIQQFKTRNFFTFFFFLWIIFLSWIRIRIWNADPDPATQMNADPCGSRYGNGSGSETLVIGIYNITPTLLKYRTYLLALVCFRSIQKMLIG